jgi:hypothetical protein
MDVLTGGAVQLGRKRMTGFLPISLMRALAAGGAASLLLSTSVGGQAFTAGIPGGGTPGTSLNPKA